MPCRVEDGEGIHCIEVWGQTSTWEVLTAIRELWKKDPHKQTPDLWRFAQGCMLSFDGFVTIADAVFKLCPRGARPSRTAIVVADQFQRAQADLYRAEARKLPFEVGVFTSHDDALTWLKQ